MPSTNTQADVTVTVNRDVAHALIARVGERNPRGGWNIAGVHYWETDEALGIALALIAAVPS